ncbi:MAG TPA: aminotransferase class I/II-fold pyridoxal phosphate-dependent enzyme [Steroidobacteraceae bacterium]|nr:aminotransferase class I/II-fold pyridoxal phosphate-dependent enzyme [Steroidobacteraceae bacterium]
MTELGLPQRLAGGARQADRELLAQAPAGFLDTTHFDTVRFPPPPWALRAFAEAAADGSLAYTGYRGNARVLEQVAGSLAGFTGERFDPHRELILTPGTQAGLFGALSALVNEGDLVLLVDPDYLFSERILRFLGARVQSVPLLTEGEIRPDLDLLEECLRQQQPKLLLFSHPNNPTGAVYSPAVIARLAELAVRHDLWVVVDELYARLLYDDVSYAHLAAQPSMRERTVTLFGPSKTESLSGYRLGVVAAPPQVIAAMEDVQSITSLRAPAYAQHVLSPWLRDDRDWLAERLQEFDRLRHMTVEAFRSMPWLRISLPAGTAYAWPDVSALGQPDTVIAGALLKEAGVLVSPGYQFGAHGCNHFRVCFARDEREWAAALERMKSVLEGFARKNGLTRG